MATAPPSPERLELGPGLFWLRSKVFSLLRLPGARSDFTQRRSERCWMSRGGKEREKREEERREGQNLGVGRHRVGGGRKAKSITSLLERSQKGKDMSQWTDCTSLSLSCSSWTAAKPLVFKSLVLQLELGLVDRHRVCRLPTLLQVSTANRRSLEYNLLQRSLSSPESRNPASRPVPGSLSSLLHLRNRPRQPLPASMPGTLPDPTMPGSSAVLMPMERQMSMGSNMMGMQGPAHNNSCSSTHIPSMHSEAKLRLKAALSHHPGTIANGNMNSMGHMMEMMSSRQEQSAHHHMHSHPHQHLQAPPHAYQHHGHHHHNNQGHGQGQGGHHHPQGHNPHHNSHNPHLHPGHPHQTSPHPTMHSASQMSPATQQMQPSQTLQSPPPSGGRRRRVMDEDPDERRRKFLERNRAAATRCRQKRKVWVVSLEKKAEELTQTNMQLQNEVTMLKSEVTQLKQLLLTHKDCHITTMQKDPQGYLSPESSPAGSPAPVCSQQQVIQHNTITTSTTTVGGSGVHGQANHRTDINPIH
ncbi:unnamed protein product [Pleuronectes platessa]|uniref:BZIP domain-containing protein n=1 Tax=Pleuronectes platessa TaxID=8262 RepID=A0A9N7YVX6_PLEPL|nr:unnamed protein product [Pleuronectes platessa]